MSTDHLKLLGCEVLLLRLQPMPQFSSILSSCCLLTVFILKHKLYRIILYYQASVSSRNSANPAIVQSISFSSPTERQILTLSGPLGGVGWGGGWGNACADFNLREPPCYLSNTYKNFATFTKVYWRTIFRKFLFCQGYHLLPWQPDFRRNV